MLACQGKTMGVPMLPRSFLGQSSVGLCAAWIVVLSLKYMALIFDLLPLRARS